MNPKKTPFEREAAQMAADLKRGISVFQKPENNPNSAMPFNLQTGNRYPGASALVLLTQKREDPRWATFNQANRNSTAVLKGATPTTISFKSQYEYQPAIKDGEPILKGDGKPRYDLIKLDQPKDVEVKLWNGEQLRKLEKWEKPAQEFSPAERAEAILENSGVNIEHGGDEMLYDKATDTILLPEPDQFASKEQYLAEAIHQLVHRELDSQPERVDMGIIKEELRTNIASLFLDKELGLPYDLNYHAGYANSWAQTLTEEPGELLKAAADAQIILDHVLKYEPQLEQKQETVQEQQQEETAEKEATAGITSEATFDSGKLHKDEVIPYNGKEFKVLTERKNKNYQIEDLSNNRRFKVTPNDEFFKSLLDARNNSQERTSGVSQTTRIENSEAISEEQSLLQEYDEVMAR